MGKHEGPAPAKVETKVWASTAATFLTSGAIAALNSVQENHALLGSMPTALQGLVIVLAPTLVTFLSGWAARHSPREPKAE